eukprot:6212921-Pleurochrysis_carterae.AAC.2
MHPCANRIAFWAFAPHALETFGTADQIRIRAHDFRASTIANRWPAAFDARQQSEESWTIRQGRQMVAEQGGSAKVAHMMPSCNQLTCCSLQASRKGMQAFTTNEAALEYLETSLS